MRSSQGRPDHCRSSYHGSKILAHRIASDFLMVVSGEPDKGTEDMLPGRKLVSGGSCFDRLKAHRRNHELWNKPLGNPG